MPKYWVKNYFAHGRFPEVGQKRKYVITMAKLRMAHASTHGARKPPGPICSELTLKYSATIIIIYSLYSCSTWPMGGDFLDL